MKLLIKNIGPITNNNQEIDLNKKVYVFLGPNNSGKTIVSQLLWTIFKQDIIREFSNEIDLDNLLFESNKFTINESIIAEILERFAKHLKGALYNTFNIEKTDSKINYILKDIELSFSFDINEVKNNTLKIVTQIGVKEMKNQFNFLNVNKRKGSLIFNFTEGVLPEEFNSHVPHNRIEQDRSKIKKNSLVRGLMTLLLRNNHDTFYLPASRLFYPIFYRYIYDLERQRREKDISRLLDMFEKRDAQKSDAKLLRNILSRPYTQPINEIFEKLYELNLKGESNSTYESLLKQLSNILGGSVASNFDKEYSIAEFSFKLNKEGKNLPMYLSSSSVNQLTLLFLYFQYWAKDSGNFLMIDEPEENLHPENQFKLVDILIQFALKKDNRVLITTHSPLMAEILNNYIYLSQLNEYSDLNLDEMFENGDLHYLNRDISLTKKEVGAYFFTGNQIIDYETDDYGIYYRNFKEISDNVEKNSKLLTDMIFLKSQCEENE